MMKSNEERKALKTEGRGSGKKLAELSEEELGAVNGGQGAFNDVSIGNITSDITVGIK